MLVSKEKLLRELLQLVSCLNSWKRKVMELSTTTTLDTDEKKPFKCEICDAYFEKKKNLINILHQPMGPVQLKSNSDLIIR